MSQATICKDRVDIQFLKLNSEILESTFAMGGIILYTGWVLDLTGLKLYLILLQQLMAFRSRCGESKLEMQLLLTTTSVLVSIESVLKFIQINSQVVMVVNLKNNLVISMVAPM